MEVIFSKPTVLGNRSYKKGKQEVPDSLAHNLAFKKLIQSGAVQVVPRDAARQKIQTAKDTKVLQKAKAMRKAHKALQSAQGASSAHPASSSASGSVQALPTPAKPILAGATVKASEPVAPVTAQEE
jgi:hypothetical protein